MATSGGAGYSGTPLPKKLGIKAGHVVAVLDGPDHVDDLLVPLPDDVTIRRNGRGKPDVSLVFCRTEAALARRVEQMWRLALPDHRRMDALDIGLSVAWAAVLVSSGIVVARRTGMADSPTAGDDPSVGGFEAAGR